MKHTIAITRFPFESQLGGEELHTLSLAKHWQNQGHKVKLFSSCPILIKLFSENNLPYESCELAKPPVTKFGPLRFLILYPIYLFRAQKIAQRIKTYGADAVYMLSFGEKLTLPWFLTKKIKFVFCEHARIGNWFRLNPWRLLYLKFADRGKVVTVSKQSATALGYEKTITIPNGLNVEEFADTSNKNSSETLVITTIGRLTEDKGMRQFIQSIGDFADNYPKNKNWQAQIIGSGPLLNELEQEVKNLGLTNKIAFRGMVGRAEIIESLRQTDVFCLLSTKPDPFGLVVAEAMAAGATAIATNVCGIVDYTNAIISVPVNAPNVVSQKLLELAEKRPTRQEMQAVAKSKFSEEQMLTVYDKLWQ